MTPAHLLFAALALGVALSCASASSDRYEDDESQRRGLRTEATDVTREDADRSKRAYSVFSRYSPALYQLKRPYFIPVYGTVGKVPIFFPPQRLQLNPGTPIANPLPNRPFRGPGYLPPTTEKATTMNIKDRFGDDDDDDDRPIWGESQGSSSAAVVPTRPPRPPGMPDFPPLVHDISNGASNSLTAEESRPVRSTTVRSITSGPSNCVWAIISCCSANSTSVPDRCFEQRGCPGPFWGSSPCDSDFARAAIASASKYYGS